MQFSKKEIRKLYPKSNFFLKKKGGGGRLPSSFTDNDKRVRGRYQTLAHGGGGLVRRLRGSLPQNVENVNQHLICACQQME